MRSAAAALIAAGLLAAPAAHGSVWIASGAVHPGLAVDARGDALVTWRSGGVSQSVVVPAKGRLYHGGSLSGPDVSRASGVRVPFSVAVRRVESTQYALQVWQAQPNGPPELHFARWTGALPALHLALAGGRLTGSATYGGKPLTGFSTTLEGKRERIYVYLDCLGCRGSTGAWKRMIGVAPRADGSFALFLRPEWTGTRYRATLVGPGYAPDAEVEIGGA